MKKILISYCLSLKESNFYIYLIIRRNTLFLIEYNNGHIYEYTTTKYTVNEKVVMFDTYIFSDEHMKYKNIDINISTIRQNKYFKGTIDHIFCDGDLFYSFDCFKKIPYKYSNTILLSPKKDFMFNVTRYKYVSDEKINITFNCNENYYKDKSCKLVKEKENVITFKKNLFVYIISSNITRFKKLLFFNYKIEEVYLDVRVKRKYSKDFINIDGEKAVTISF